ncbi:hypothetical protein BSK62_06375 [Paenibacillus odorifer]|uniref:hypothetical protein n=2 Tax=Paenibacillus TaxID=44249 RepID=UPI00096CFA1F|nr:MULTISPECIES: hypothetical protein [Paenibacillus]MDH6428067.1 putative transcriptional regulator [Paenibacillus sp. PastH-4]MDH6444303.1 putative transcriptional regulator [Paenibacillus sp. PastF-4]MDH6528204.1 putative transcriptional regulator [Paenibacillus sp. PastH-3]OMD67831.1 hypothetical protein BSK62_06375 [Paenibacillus odorifer]
MDYRDVLIIFYMNSVKEDYIYADLVELLGLTYTYVIDKIDYLIEQEYLIVNERKIIEVGRKGIEILSEKRFLDINIFDLYDGKELVDGKISKQLEINDIYIPKNFDEKFKGY